MSLNKLFSSLINFLYFFMIIGRKCEKKGFSSIEWIEKFSLVNTFGNEGNETIGLTSFFCSIVESDLGIGIARSTKKRHSIQFNGNTWSRCDHIDRHLVDNTCTSHIIYFCSISCSLHWFSSSSHRWNSDVSFSLITTWWSSNCCNIDQYTNKLHWFNSHLDFNISLCDILSWSWFSLSTRSSSSNLCWTCSKTLCSITRDICYSFSWKDSVHLCSSQSKWMSNNKIWIKKNFSFETRRVHSSKWKIKECISFSFFSSSIFSSFIEFILFKVIRNYSRSFQKFSSSMTFHRLEKEQLKDFFFRILSNPCSMFKWRWTNSLN